MFDRGGGDRLVVLMSIFMKVNLPLLLSFTRLASRLSHQIRIHLYHCLVPSAASSVDLPSAQLEYPFWATSCPYHRDRRDPYFLWTASQATDPQRR
jgi:hypothetical protein